MTTHRKDIKDIKDIFTEASYKRGKKISYEKIQIKAGFFSDDDFNFEWAIKAYEKN